MLNKILFILLLLFATQISQAASINKFDIQVCEAYTNDTSKIKCYSELIIDNRCEKIESSKKLVCYRKSAELMLANSSKEDLENKNNPQYTEIAIPRSVPGDKGQYFLMEYKRVGDIVYALHKRIGVDSIGYTRTETDCDKMLMRAIGYSEESPSKIKSNPTDWFELVYGSSKSDLANFICNKMPQFNNSEENIKRESTKNEFKTTHPCPISGNTSGSCSSTNDSSNISSQTKEDSKLKEKQEIKEGRYTVTVNKTAKNPKTKSAKTRVLYDSENDPDFANEYFYRSQSYSSDNSGYSSNGSSGYSTNPTVYTGKRGGRYTISSGGHKNYIRRK